MKSNICYLTGENPDMAGVLKEVELVAAHNKLSSKEAIQLRLLAEEMIGMQRGILGFAKGEFYIENKDKTYQLCLHADINVDTETRERFLNLSANSKNSAYRGFMGKVRLIADTLLNDSGADDFCQHESYGGSIYFGQSAEYDKVWEFSQYKEEVEQDSKEWDEMEKSIVANLADDVIIGTRKNYIDIVVVKKF
ncbi:MAG: hypothetical protein IJO97_08250 [Lachnospiraceae bacterium]|nr:hypothetical protein [Lachnospiraceae bacterium]